MFSKFSNTIRSFLGTSGSDQESVDKSAPSEQLYAELSDALNQDMVTTRRQSHGLPNEDLRDGSEIDTPRTASKKRNLPASSIPVVRSAKRRKSTAQDTGSDGGASESNLQDGATHVDTANGTGVKVVKQDEGDSDVDKQRLVPELENTESRSRTNGKSSNGKDTQALASAETGIPNLATDQEEQKNPTTIKVADPEPTLSPPNPKRYSQPVPVSSGQSTAKATSSITKAKISKATHLRFGSEEPGVEALPAEKEQALSETMSANTVENLEKSDEDDEAPEFVTASAGADTARARAMEEAKAVERQRVVSRTKRRERDELLKKQALNSKKQRKRKTEKVSGVNSDSDNSANSDDAVPPASHDRVKTKDTSTRRLPALLPDEILAAEPVARPPTPPLNPEHRKKSKPKNHKLLRFESNPPKDVVRGPVRVRVLEVGQPTLPPKQSKESRNLRESWLAGRRGRNSAVGFERRKVGGGMVRR